MIINQTRIRSVEAHLNHIEKGNEFIIGVENAEKHKDQLNKIGFPKKLEVGHQILPPGLGPISKFNAYGKYNKHTDQPMETAYYQREWTWEDWGGYEHSKIVDVPYKRYPRDFIKPPSVELRVVKSRDGKLIVSDSMIKKPENFEIIKHTINLFLEIFGECLVLDQDYKNIEVPEIKKLNWEILPPGEYPWDKVKDHVKKSINEAPEGKRPVIEYRIMEITKHNPTYIAVGKGGFNGYWVFGFPKHDTFVLESNKYGNATYIFDGNWETYSQLTKSEIIDSDLHEHRVIHREGWIDHIDSILNFDSEKVAVSQ